MGPFRFTDRSTQTDVFADIVAHYRRLRPTRLRLNAELVRQLSPDMLTEGAKRLGMYRGGTLVFENEDETSVLMDYCIYDIYRKGRNAIDLYLCNCPPDPDSDEMACLRAMQHATYTLVATLNVEPGVGWHVRNLFTDETQLLVDIGLSKTAQPNAVIATRLVDFGDFVVTGGAALPLGILNEREMDKWQHKIRLGVDAGIFNPAEMIRASLQREATSHVRYEEIDSQHRFDAAEQFSQGPASLKQRRALAKRHANKTAAQRRCRCGSGKMYKNCCGKR